MFKSLRDILPDFMREEIPSDRLIYYEIYAGELCGLKYPTPYSSMTCTRCKGNVGYCCLAEAEDKIKYAWFCLNEDCLKYNASLSKINAKVTYLKEFERELLFKKAQGFTIST